MSALPTIAVGIVQPDCFLFAHAASECTSNSRSFASLRMTRVGEWGGVARESPRGARCPSFVRPLDANLGLGTGAGGTKGSSQFLVSPRKIPVQAELERGTRPSPPAKFPFEVPPVLCRYAHPCRSPKRRLGQ